MTHFWKKCGFDTKTMTIKGYDLSKEWKSLPFFYEKNINNEYIVSIKRVKL